MTHPADRDDDDPVPAPEEWHGDAPEPPDPPDVDSETETSLLRGGVCIRTVGSSTEWLQYLGPVDIDRLDGPAENVEKKSEE